MDIKNKFNLNFFQESKNKKIILCALFLINNFLKTHVFKTNKTLKFY